MPDTETGGDQSQERFTNARGKLDRDMVRWTRAVAVFTFFLVVATGISAYFIWGQWHVAAQAQSTLLMESRAFFSVGAPVQNFASTDKDGKPSAGFFGQWTNLGSTRANWATGWASIQYFPTDVPYNFDTSKPNVSIGQQTRLAVGPNAPIQTQLVGIGHDESTQADSGKGTLLMWGALDYTDLFTPYKVRHGTFCYKLVPTGKVQNSATKEVRVAYVSIPFRPDCNTAE